MNIKKIIIGLMIAGMAWGTGISYAGDRFDRRQDRRTGRIHQGVKSGSVARNVYGHLKDEQSRIERAEDRAWRDGRLTHRERERLDRMQDRAGRHIYQPRHNNRENRWHRNDCDPGRWQGGRHHNYKPMSHHNQSIVHGFGMIFLSGY